MSSIKLCRDIGILHQGFSAQWRDSTSTDLILVCSDGRLQMHQFVLVAASPLLRDVLANPRVFQEDAATILLPDFSKEQVTYMASFLYGMSTVDVHPWVHDLLDCLRIGGWEIYCKDGDSAVDKETVTFDIKVEEPVVPGVDNVLGTDEETDGDWVPDEISEPDEEAISETDEEVPMPEHEAKQRGRKRRFVQLENGKWQCLLCKKTVKQRYMFVGHFEKVHSDLAKESKDEGHKKPKSGTTECVAIDGGFECSNCKLFVTHKFKLRHHLCWFNHDVEDISETSGYECGGCATSFSERYNLVDHLNRHGKTCAEGTFACDQCEIVLYDIDSSKFHSMQHKDAFQCEQCDKSFVKGENYLKHWTVAHSRVKSVHKCPHCDRVFDYKKNMLNHIKSHDKSIGHSCDQCERTFSCKSSLIYHLQKHTNPTLECSKCPRTFKSARGLKYHMNIHDGIADYLCDDCGRGFITKQKLQNHRRSKHTFEKPYFCDQCPERFFRSDKLTVHQRRAHTGEKPYKCDVCEWKGVDSSSLIHHRRRHATPKKGSKRPRVDSEKDAGVVFTEQDISAATESLHHGVYSVPEISTSDVCQNRQWSERTNEQIGREQEIEQYV